MNTLNLYYRTCIYFTMALSLFHPTLQIAATQSHPIQKDISSHQTDARSVIIKGKLKNGLTFTLAPSSQLKGGAWIKLDYPIPQNEDNKALSLLTQHALFYGTKKYSREKIALYLNNLGLDVEADSYVKSNEKEQSLQFCLDQTQTENLSELLAFIHQMTFYPTLTNENIELARDHLLANLKEESEKEILRLQSITAEELRKFHAQLYTPEKMHLTLFGISSVTEMLHILSRKFESSIEVSEEIYLKETHQDKENALSYFTDSVVFASDSQTYVVDGKIWMKEPDWMNKSSNGKTLGTLLTILGIGGMIFAFPIIAPMAILAGGLTTATGLYFLSSDYLKDPYYIEQIRHNDLEKGCIFAYQKDRAGVTLTPYERRALFLLEMIDRPQILPDLPIFVLADIYQLNDPIIAEIFTVDEFNTLSHFKRNFIQHRNQFKMLKEMLKKELADLIAPYALTRDAALLYAQDLYRTNYYVVTKENLKASRDASIEEIKEAYHKQQISLEEKEALIQQAHDYYEACVCDPIFKTGLNLAESTLIQMELDIQATYHYQVEICKQSIQYNVRMEQVKMDKQSLIHDFNQELISLLTNFPVYLTLLPDYLDLRSL